MTGVSSVKSLLGVLASIGVSAADDDSTRSQKVTLTLTSMIVTALSVVWIGTYWACLLYTSPSPRD